MTQLPAVASNFYHDCKKCGVERYHKVLVHPTPESAKIKCEVCGKTSTFKPKKIVNGVVKKVTKAKTTSKNAYTDEFNVVKSKLKDKDVISYNMRTTFKVDQTIQHPKFGVGFVKSVMVDKIEVYFEDESRLLVHARS